MQLANSGLEEGINWNIHVETDQGRLEVYYFYEAKILFLLMSVPFRMYASWQRISSFMRISGMDGATTVDDTVAYP